MIAADTSAWVDFSKGSNNVFCSKIERALRTNELALPMHVLFEILSSPGITDDARQLTSLLPRLEIKPLFWEGAGKMRSQLLKNGLKARSMDVYIAQNFIDFNVPLIAADHDFRHFKSFGLIIA